MKVYIGFLTALVLVLTAAVAWLVVQDRTAPLSTDDLATALGMKHWHYTVPASINADDHLRLEVVTPDEVRNLGGGSAGWKPGEVVTIVMVPNTDGSRVRWSIINQARTATITLSNENPIAGLTTIRKMPHEVADDGLLVKGVEDGSVSWHNTNPSEVAIRARFHSWDR